MKSVNSKSEVTVQIPLGVPEIIDSFLKHGDSTVAILLIVCFCFWQMQRLHYKTIIKVMKKKK